MDVAALSRALTEARRAVRPLAAFPGPLPGSLADSYAVQEAGIVGWPDAIAGWKVAGIHPDFRSGLGAERLAGPIFARQVARCEAGGAATFSVFPGGFAAIEAEIVAELAHDLSAESELSPDGLRASVWALRAGMENAGSALATINDLGPLAVASDFGNNAGLVVGPEIPGWRDRADAELCARTEINGQPVGQGHAGLVAGGPFGALAFLARHLIARGRPLRAGQFVSTGMMTGIHLVQPGDKVRIVFSGDVEIVARAVARAAEGS